jgi:bacterioferritin
MAAREPIGRHGVPLRVLSFTDREMVRCFGDRDPTTRVLLERILAQEEEHADDMHDLLVTHEGRPMLDTR